LVERNTIKKNGRTKTILSCRDAQIIKSVKCLKVYK
jgi:hypothetical protein